MMRKKTFILSTVLLIFIFTPINVFAETYPDVPDNDYKYGVTFINENARMEFIYLFKDPVVYVEKKSNGDIVGLKEHYLYKYRRRQGETNFKLVWDGITKRHEGNDILFGKNNEIFLDDSEVEFRFKNGNVFYSKNTNNIDNEIDADVEAGTGLINIGNNGKYFETYESDEPTYLEKQASKFLISVTDGIQNSLSLMKVSIDSIVFGKVNPATGKSSPLLFSFDPGNPFGVISVKLYHLFRGFSYMMMFSILTLLGIKVMSTTNTAREQANFKKILTTFSISFILLFIMPDIINFGVWIKNQIINMLIHGYGGELNFVDALRNNAKETLSFFDALLYCSTLLTTLWFAFVYISISMTMAVLFMSFPLASLTMNSDKTKMVINNWSREASSLLIIPIMDTGLLLIPTYAVTLGIPRMFIIFMIMMIMPARTLTRRIFGMGGGGLELAGIGFMLGASRLVSTAINGAKGAIGGIREGVADYRTGKIFGGMINSESEPIENTNAEGMVGLEPTMTLEPIDYSDELKGIPSMSKEGELAYSSVVGTTSLGRASYQNMRGYQSRENELLNQYAEKYGTTSILNDPSIANRLEPKIKSDLYKKRAKEKIFKSFGQAAGGLAGGAVGAGAGIFLGPTGVAYGASLGGQTGSALGEGLAYAGLKSASPVFDFGKTAMKDLKSLYNSIRTNNQGEIESGGLPSIRQSAEMEAAESFSSQIAEQIHTHKTQRMDNARVEFEGYKDQFIGGQSAYGSLAGNAPNVRVLSGEEEAMEAMIEKIMMEDPEPYILKKGIVMGRMGKDGYIKKAEKDYYNSEISKLQEEGVKITQDVEIRLKHEARDFANSETIQNEAHRVGFESMNSYFAKHKIDKIKEALNIDENSSQYKYIQGQLKQSLYNIMDKYDSGHFRNIDFNDINVDEHFV